MASFVAACRLSTRLSAGQLRQDRRGLRTFAANFVAQNLTMPALSPTMTEGNIARWNIKEGDAFSAGDVLLEIETDKASMDVEAQDNGILAKIIQGDGSKSIKVGTRIGVLADADDDLRTLEITKEESAPAPAKKDASIPARETNSLLRTKSPPSADAPKKASGPVKKQTYPLLPSVEHLIHEHGLDQAAIDQMTPSGPNNRLLKGDVLAYLGHISASYPAELSSKISKLSHLDLSNIKLVAPAPAPKAPELVSSVSESVVENFDITMPVSLAGISEVQKRIQTTLGVSIPLSTFIARATDLANENLPRSKTYKPSADELFYGVLGLDKVSASVKVRGKFSPDISTIKLPANDSSRPIKAQSQNLDIIDILTGKRPSRKSVSSVSSTPPTNLFRVVVPKDDEKRATLFLNRLKTFLESEPGRLVL